VPRALLERPRPHARLRAVHSIAWGEGVEDGLGRENRHRIHPRWATRATRDCPSNRLSPLYYGGRDRGRTGDLIVANDALSQLSYSPTVRLLLNDYTSATYPLHLRGLRGPRKKRGNSLRAKGQVTRVLTKFGQLETGGTARLGRKVATLTGWHERCDWRQCSTDL
jgi:hypothetical protein